MLLNCKQCGKNINEWFLQYTVSTDSKVSGKESIFFPFVGRLMHRMTQNCYWMLIKIKKIVMEPDLRTNDRSLSLMNEDAIVRLSTQMNAYFLIMNSKRFSWKKCDSPSSKFKLEREISWWQTHKLVILMITERTARLRLEIYLETGWGVMTCYACHTEILNP